MSSFWGRYHRIRISAQERGPQQRIVVLTPVIRLQRFLMVESDLYILLCCSPVFTGRGFDERGQLQGSAKDLGLLDHLSYPGAEHDVGFELPF
jgi:hypothetical protein